MAKVVDFCYGRRNWLSLAAHSISLRLDNSCQLVVVATSTPLYLLHHLTLPVLGFLSVSATSSLWLCIYFGWWRKKLHHGCCRRTSPIQYCVVWLLASKLTSQSELTDANGFNFKSWVLNYYRTKNKPLFMVLLIDNC